MEISLGYLFVKFDHWDGGSLSLWF